ncbi:hypothetical protein EYZ11_004506 [Aspergillus tanneri]|uniref:Uncharacterized protein n=1 Tax=Aspergillus tanneri TaxID=1220188 RepID=A0A4S3JMP2_9EURO|nr:hypothetical protein EYZ11_004506 [Aspergillus tanneri]
MASYLITGSSRGLGLAILDTTNQESVQEAVKQVEQQLQGKGLDVLVNNAGVMPITREGIEKMDALTETFNTNVTGTHMVTSAFLPLLRKGERKLVTNISSTMGSITMAPIYKPIPTPEYKITKAALNMLTKQYAQNLADEGFTFLSVCPGWLQTDMGGSRADLPVATGAEAVMRIMSTASSELNGLFMNIHVPGWEENPGPNKYDGKEIPW